MRSGSERKSAKRKHATAWVSQEKKQVRGSGGARTAEKTARRQHAQVSATFDHKHTTSRLAQQKQTQGARRDSTRAVSPEYDASLMRLLLSPGK